jgi:hypothetical protein
MQTEEYVSEEQPVTGLLCSETFDVQRVPSAAGDVWSSRKISPYG